MDTSEKSVSCMTLISNTKTEKTRSELWISLITSIGTLVTVYFAPAESTARTLGMVSAVLIAGVYAFFRTPLAARTSGVKTKMFWGSLLTVLGSMAAVLADQGTKGVPQPVAHVAAIVVTAVVASGYTVHRFRTKVRGK